MSDRIRTLKEDAARLIARNKLAEAAECYEKVVKFDGKDLTARQKLAELYGRLGKKDRAVHLYQSVAGSYAADGLLLKAIAICKIILQLDPKHTETQTILADLSTKRRGTDEPPKKVQMSGAMAEALRNTKRAADIRGVPASQVRPALPAEQVRAQAAAAAVAVQTPAPAAPAPSAAPAQPAIILPAPVLAQVQSKPEDIKKAAAAMLPEAPPPLVAGVPVPLPSTIKGIEIDLSGLDVSSEGEAIVVGTAEVEVDVPLPATSRAQKSAPILTAAIDAAVPSFDELMDMVSDIGEAVPVAEAQDEIEFDESDDGEGEVLDLEPQQIDTNSIPPIPLFSDLPREAFLALTEKMDLRVCGVDEPLITEGEGGDSMFVIIQGKVKVSRTSDEQETILAELNDGAFFGEMALLSDAPRTASVICTEETMLFVISRELVREVTEQFPSVGDVMRKFHKNRLITNLLKTSPIFQPFSSDDKKSLIEKFKSRTVQDGSYLITREKPGDGLYVVLSGRCEVLDVIDNAETVIAELKEGDVFGEMSMLWNKDTCASVRATTACTVLRLPRQQFAEVIMTHPQILETLSHLSEKRAAHNRELRQGIATEWLL